MECVIENIDIRSANPADLSGLLELMPRLSAFDLPASRDPNDLWRHDAELLKEWAAGNVRNCLVHVAVNRTDQAIAGLVVTTLKPEILSGEPSAHLEAIVVAEHAQGIGLGTRLIETTEAASIERGALSITLHVFSLNRRARAVYKRAGYDEELIRCRKRLS